MFNCDVCVCTHTYIRAYIRAHVPTYTNACINTYRHVHICDIHTYIHTYTHQVWVYLTIPPPDQSGYFHDIKASVEHFVLVSTGQ
jgi:hypothetical protein